MGPYKKYYVLQILNEANDLLVLSNIMFIIVLLYYYNYIIILLYYYVYFFSMNNFSGKGQCLKFTFSSFVNYKEIPNSVYFNLLFRKNIRKYLEKTVKCFANDIFL